MIDNRAAELAALKAQIAADKAEEKARKIAEKEADVAAEKAMKEHGYTLLQERLNEIKGLVDQTVDIISRTDNFQAMLDEIVEQDHSWNASLKENKKANVQYLGKIQQLQGHFQNLLDILAETQAFDNSSRLRECVHKLIQSILVFSAFLPTQEKLTEGYKIQNDAHFLVYDFMNKLIQLCTYRHAEYKKFNLIDFVYGGNLGPALGVLISFVAAFKPQVRKAYVYESVKIYETFITSMINLYQPTHRLDENAPPAAREFELTNPANKPFDQFTDGELQAIYREVDLATETANNKKRDMMQQKRGLVEGVVAEYSAHSLDTHRVSQMDSQLRDIATSKDVLSQFITKYEEVSVLLSQSVDKVIQANSGDVVTLLKSEKRIKMSHEDKTNPDHLFNRFLAAHGIEKASWPLYQKLRSNKAPVREDAAKKVEAIIRIKDIVAQYPEGPAATLLAKYPGLLQTGAGINEYVKELSQNEDKANIAAELAAILGAEIKFTTRLRNGFARTKTQLSATKLVAALSPKSKAQSAAVSSTPDVARRLSFTPRKSAGLDTLPVVRDANAILLDLGYEPVMGRQSENQAQAELTRQYNALSAAITECKQLRARFDTLEKLIVAQKPIAMISAEYQQLNSRLQGVMKNTYTRFMRFIEWFANLLRIQIKNRPAALQYYYKAQEIQADLTRAYSDSFITGEFGNVLNTTNIGTANEVEVVANSHRAVAKWHASIAALKNDSTGKTKDLISRGFFGKYADVGLNLQNVVKDFVPEDTSVDKPQIV